MRIDSHHHVWDLRARPQPWTKDLPALQRSFGIDELRPSLCAARHWRHHRCADSGSRYVARPGFQSLGADCGRAVSRDVPDRHSKVVHSKRDIAASMRASIEDLLIQHGRTEI
jgi:hypothetical protein